MGYSDGVPREDLEAEGIDLSLWNDNVKHLAMLYDNSYEFSEDENAAPVPRNPMCLLEWLRRNQPNVFAPENELLPTAEGSSLNPTSSSAIAAATAITNGANGAAALGAGAGASEYGETNPAIDGIGINAPSAMTSSHYSATAASSSVGSTLDSAAASGSAAGANSTGKQRRKRKNISVIHNYHTSQHGGALPEGGAVPASGTSTDGPKKIKRPRKNAKNSVATKTEITTSIPVAPPSVSTTNSSSQFLTPASPGTSHE